MAADTTVHGMAGAGTADTIPVVILVVADTLVVADIPVAVGILVVADIPVAVGILAVADIPVVADTWGEDTTDRTECLIPACIASIGH